MERTLIQLFKAFSNPNRVEIYKICLKEKINITELSKRMKLSYKTTCENINVLERANLIKKENVKKEGKVPITLISSIPMNKDYIGTKLLQELEKEKS